MTVLSCVNPRLQVYAPHYSRSFFLCFCKSWLGWITVNIKNKNATATNGKIVCGRCHELQARELFAENIWEQPRRHWICKPCKGKRRVPDTRHCTRCKQELNEEDFDRRENGNFFDVCRNCQHPKCGIASCDKRVERIWAPSCQTGKSKPMCDECRSKIECTKCLRRLPTDNSVVEDNNG